MGILNPDPKKKSNRDLRQLSLLATVPTMLIAGPAIGFLAGRWLDKKFDTEPLLLICGIILGFASAGVEIYRLVKKAEQFNRENDDTK